MLMVILAPVGVGHWQKALWPRSRMRRVNLPRLIARVAKGTGRETVGAGLDSTSAAAW
jgi:hypothetical protein